MAYKKCKKAFTFTEALMAVAILSIATAGVVLPFAAGASVQNEGARHTLACLLASERIEKIKNTEYDDIVSNFQGTEAAGSLTAPDGSTFTGMKYQYLSRTTNCTNAYVAGNPALLIEVTVAYKSKPLVTLQTLVCQ
jgi:type II secretory pathway pseudopilin PulG